MKSLILVMMGGGMGAGLRHLLNVAVLRFSGAGTDAGTNATAWPWSTFAANVLGGLLMGALMGWLTHSGRGLDHGLRLLLGVGLLGGFTTFSAFSMEMASMIQRGDVWQSAVYALLSVLLAVAAVFAGLAVSKGVFA
jgi:fluoride exporter